MTITEILEQAKHLSIEERKELTKRLIDMLDFPSENSAPADEEHWGHSLNKVFAEMDAIEMKYPEIDDPVEWVQHLRAEGRKHLSQDESELE